MNIKDWIQKVVDRATDPNSPLKEENVNSFLTKILSLGTIPFWGLTLFLFVIWNIITGGFHGGWIGLILYCAGAVAYLVYVVFPRVELQAKLEGETDDRGEGA